MQSYLGLGNSLQTAQAVSTSLGATRGVFGGGHDGASYNIMDYITIDTTGNAIDFGDLTSGRWSLAGVSSSTRGVFVGGLNGATHHNTMDYITIATTGNAIDFGDLTVARNGIKGLSSSTRGFS